MIDDLVSLAEMLSSQRSEVAWRRAVSTCYYALFHKLAKLCADALAAAENQAEYETVYRNIDHASARRALHDAARAASEDLKRVAVIFQGLQEWRQSADYRSALFPLTQIEAKNAIAIVKEGLNLIDRLPAPEQRSLVFALSFKRRGNA
jgi:hypothetical protein